MKTAQHPPRSGQAGVTLIEALVAMLIMAIGMLALIGLQNNLRRAADVAKQRGEATQVAQADLELSRDFSVISNTALLPNIIAYSDLVGGTYTNAGLSTSNANYVLKRSVSQLPEPLMTYIDDTVTWIDRSGNGNNVVEFGSIIAGNDPALSGSLEIAPTNGTNNPSPGRAASIPPGAVPVGSGLSGFVPSANSTVAWVFNNATGVIVGVCLNIPLNTPSSGLVTGSGSGATNLTTNCNNNANALLLSGYVHYSFATPPNPNNPSDLAILPGMQLNVTSTGNPTPASQCFVNIPSGNNTVATYYCAVYPNSSSLWSGQLTLSGITLGAGHDKVCAYNANYSSFATAAAPFTYTGVTTALTQQNFLVILYSQSCPAGTPVNIAAGQFVNTSTVQIQP